MHLGFNFGVGSEVVERTLLLLWASVKKNFLNVDHVVPQFMKGLASYTQQDISLDMDCI